MVSQITPKGFRYAICSLRAKRAEIAGSLVSLKLQEASYERDLAKIDDILLILDPAADPTQITPRKPIKQLNLFKQGEMGALLVGILRASEAPMTCLEICQAVLDRGGYDRSLWTPIRRRCRANLEYQLAQGRVIKVGSHRTAKWTINSKVRE